MKQKLRIAFRWYFAALILCYLLLSLLPVDLEPDSTAGWLDGTGSRFVVTPNGDLVSWGEADRYVLGDGFEIYHPYLARRTILRDVSFVCADSMHPMAVDKSGNLWAWGFLRPLSSIEATSNPYVPAKVMEDVAAVGNGDYHAAILRLDGSLWTGGSNSHGELGLGYTDGERHEPSKVLDHVSSVFAWRTRTFAVLTNGDLYTWGGMDEKGMGTASPTQIASGIQSVSWSSGGFQCRKPDGTVWIWTEAEGMSAAPVAEQVRTLISNGFIKEDDSLWGWEEENGVPGLQHKADQVVSAGNPDFYLTRDGKVHAGTDLVSHPIRTVSPLFRNLLLLGLVLRGVLQVFILREKPYAPPAYSPAIGYGAYRGEAEEEGIS